VDQACGLFCCAVGDQCCEGECSTCDTMTVLEQTLVTAEKEHAARAAELEHLRQLARKHRLQA